jgi:DNA-binding NarL/FixJ family response regulator
MARKCRLAAIAPKDVSLITAALKGAGEPGVASVARLSVRELSKLKPDILIVDLDRLQTDSLEMLRQIRFVLPDCTLVVYTGAKKLEWGRECHLAGANGILSKESSKMQLASGLYHAIESGCFTDPRIAA